MATVSLPLVASFAVVVLLLAACGDTADDSADTTVAPTSRSDYHYNRADYDADYDYDYDYDYDRGTT